MVRSPFLGIVGQDTAISLLERAIAQARIAPGYLFVGPAGVGRRLAALAFATELLGGGDLPALHRRIQQRNHPDFLWVEPTYLHQGRPVSVTEAETLGVRRKSPPQVRLEQIRDVARFLSRPPLEATRAVVVIEGAETMAESAANGLLKTLEEPGAATLILLAPDLASLLPTLISRCQAIPFRRLGVADLTLVLQRQGHETLLNQAEILALAQGSPGQAIAAWKQLQGLPEDLLSAIASLPTSLRQALELARHIAKALDLEAQLWLVDYLQYRHWHRHPNLQVIQALEQARQHLRHFVQPRLVWEVTLMTLVDDLGRGRASG